MVYAGDSVELAGEAHMENDYVLYLERWGF